jgi:hypothetical protein
VDRVGGEQVRVGGGHIRRVAVAVGRRPAGCARRNGLGFRGTAAGGGRRRRRGLGVRGILIGRRALRVAGFGIRSPMRKETGRGGAARAVQSVGSLRRQCERARDAARWCLEDLSFWALCA